MKNLICRLFGNANKKVNGNYNPSDFFTKSSEKEKREVFSHVAEKVNQDQRDVLEKYEKQQSLIK
ncbi:hypothetical protein KJ590_02920 [Patescibacteria group bacterium]|nr:hypothetical protein [Patescibacteria group bacterium]